MRILLVSEDIPYPNMGGLAKHVLNLARALIRAGHRVDVLGGDQHPLTVAGAEAAFRGIFYGELHGHLAGWKERPLGLFLPPRRTWLARRFAAAMLRHAPRYDVIHYHGHVPNVARYIPAQVNFVQTRHDQGGDCVMHTRFRDGAICTSTDPADCAGCVKRHPNALQRAVSRYAVLRFRAEVANGLARHKTIFVSEMLLRNLRRTLGADASGTVIHHFAERDRIEAACAAVHARPRDGSQQILVAGKITPAKGTAEFLRTLAPLLPPRMLVTVAGDGPGEAGLREEFSGQPQIRFPGWCSAQETLQMTAAADAIVVPSLWEEPFGSTTLEGLLLGKPTFALARGATPEMARYAQAPDQLHLHDSMAALVRDLVSHERFAEHGLAPAGCGDAQQVLEQILQVYRMPARHSSSPSGLSRLSNSQAGPTS